MKRVAYVITSPSHKRVFESFSEHPDLEQIIIGPKPPLKFGIIPEDYSNFKIKNIQFYDKQNTKSIIDIVKKIKPDLYVQPDLSNIHNMVSNYNTHKRIYVSHGMIGRHVIDLMKVEKFNTSVWQGLDLYCGASNIFRDWVEYITKTNGKVLTNALPQLDILYNSDYYNSYRKTIINKTKFPDAKKVILFIGFCCKDRADFKQHNEDYFKTAIELGKIAEKNQLLVMIKPRQTYSEMISFLQAHSWGKKYIDEYKKLNTNKYVHFIGPADTHIYRYFFADIFIINGCSTSEIEICAIQKPLFIVRTNDKCLKSGYDPYNTVSFGAAMPVPDLGELEHDILLYFNDNKFHFPDKQGQLLKNMGISFDGKMYERIQNKLLEL